MKNQLFSFNHEFLKCSDPLVSMTPERLAYKLEEEKKKAYEEGYQKGLEEVLSPTSTFFPENWRHQLLKNSSEINQCLPEILQEQKVMYDEIMDLVLLISLHIAKIIIPRFIDKHGEEEVKETISNILPTISHEKKIELRVHPRSFELISTVCKDLENLTVIEDNSLDYSDYILEWEKGGVRRNMYDLWKKIESELMIDSIPEKNGEKND